MSRATLWLKQHQTRNIWLKGISALDTNNHIATNVICLDGHRITQWHPKTSQLRDTDALKPQCLITMGFKIALISMFKNKS